MISYDFDGVFSTGQFILKDGDVIVSGRCHDEKSVIYKKLIELGYAPEQFPAIYFNTMNYKTRGDHTIKARIYSAIHKSYILNKLYTHGGIKTHYEDDPEQIKIIKLRVPGIEIIEVDNKELKFYGE